MMRFSIICVLCIFLAGDLYAKDKEELIVHSPVINENQDIASKYTCLGGDINPPLEFKHVPRKTKSFAVTLVSPDAPEGVWVHWVVYNIDVSDINIPEGSTLGTSLFNDFGMFNYNGPCPEDEKTHHYQLTAYALDTKVRINEGGVIKDLEKAIRGHVLSKATKTFTFKKLNLQD